MTTCQLCESNPVAYGVCIDTEHPHVKVCKECMNIAHQLRGIGGKNG